MRLFRIPRAGRWTALALLLAATAPAIAAPPDRTDRLAQSQDALVLVQSGRSDYRIVVTRKCPSSVRQAAEELQHYIAVATGVKLPIHEQDQAGAGPIISLGDTASARAAGIDANAVGLDGFRLRVHQDDLYIAGPDTPDGRRTVMGGMSRGTRNGVYTFLDEQLGVRWLMPGPEGEDVPTRTDLIVQPIDKTVEPPFLMRRMPMAFDDNPQVIRWLERNRLGSSLELKHYHNWRRTVPASLYDAHPDWFPLEAGQRVPPAGRYKLETTNSELVRYFADRVIQTFDQNPDQYCYSLSPSDGGGWSESPQTQALIESDPHDDRSYTPLVTQFYNDVARLVGPEHPDRVLGGYIYSQYFYPPKKGIPAMQPNLFLTIAPSIAYGYRLYQPAVREDWLNVVPAWGEALRQVTYYDLPNRIIQTLGAPNAPGLQILQTIYPRLAEGNFRGVYVYGIPSWSHGAVTNYLLARLAWDPRTDIQAAFDDWLKRAYGADAAKIMAGFYHDLDRGMEQYHLDHPGVKSTYILNREMLKAVYVQQHGSLEQKYLAAVAIDKSPAQQARLELLGDALRLLRWNLVNMDLISPDPGSPLHATDEEIDALARNTLAVAPAPDVDSHTPVDPSKLAVAVEQALPPGAVPGNVRVRGQARFLLFPTDDQPVTVQCTYLKHMGESPRLVVRDADGRQVALHVLREGRQVQLNLSPNHPYVLDVLTHRAIHALRIDRCPNVLQVWRGGRGLHLSGQAPSLSFYVDDLTQPRTVTLSSSAPEETALADVIAPGGKIVGELSTIKRSADRFVLGSDKGRPGFWSLRFRRPPSGIEDDIYLQFDPALSPWVVVGTGPALRVTETNQ
jgi:hypothetical protein